MTEATKQIEQKNDARAQTLYDRAEYCKQQIGDQTENAEHTIMMKTCISTTQINTLMKSCFQLIEDHTRDSMECIRQRVADKAKEDYKRGVESSAEK
ncbi:hypothetical protein DPMN_148444 [Dreissena polymorpha]|uniref:Uncharacterized protein n=1 Tax=Dreissena polymorpha TaxID=45954 RepID=A0A9D4F9K6_DREPO|nr:hypothetical protein DPMN_148444 [Dreissena polymorpha]